MNSKSKKVLAVTAFTGIVSIGAFYNHTSREIEINTMAAIKVDQVVKSACFEKEILKTKLVQTNGLSVKEVLDKYRSSKTMIDLEFYYSRNNVIGYTYSSVKKIWMNRKFHNSYSVCAVAKNLAHEVAHKVGFGHDMNATERRPRSVPYSIGRAVGFCCKE